MLLQVLKRIGKCALGLVLRLRGLSVLDRCFEVADDLPSTFFMLETRGETEAGVSAKQRFQRAWSGNDS